MVISVAADRTASSFFIRQLLFCVEKIVGRPWGKAPARSVPRAPPSLFQQDRFHGHTLPVGPVRGKENCPRTEGSSVQGQIQFDLWCHLACRTVLLPRPLCREPTFPCPVTEASVSGYWGLRPFPVPSANHCAASLCIPFPAPGTLCGCACSFTFASLV